MSESQNLPKIVIEGMEVDLQKGWDTHIGTFYDFTEFTLLKSRIIDFWKEIDSSISFNLSHDYADEKQLADMRKLLWGKSVKFRVTIEVIE